MRMKKTKELQLSCLGVERREHHIENVMLNLTTLPPYVNRFIINKINGVILVFETFYCSMWF